MLYYVSPSRAHERNWGSKRIFKCIDKFELGVDAVCIMNGDDKLTDNTFFYITELLKGGGLTKALEHSRREDFKREEEKIGRAKGSR
jgi:hypothetical protein